jgi:phage-related protein
MSGFSFRGVHSSQYGIFTQDQNRILIPPRREGKTTIPGRSGYYDGVTGNVYDERAESVLCSFRCPQGQTVAEVCREVAYWLSGTGRLAYDNEPDKYYTATLSGGPPMTQHLLYGEFTLTWSYNPPFALGRTVTQRITTGENAINYQGTAEAPCVIVLRNTSTTDIVNLSITAIKRGV